MAARSQLESERFGTVEQPGISTGELEDRRNFTVDSLQTDWLLARSETLTLAFGAEWRQFEGRYDYDDEVEFDLLFLTPGAPDEPTRTRTLSAAPSGHQLGVYASVRLQASPGLTADLGLRWDEESLSPSGGERLSPRLGCSRPQAARTKLRAGWGRYFQSQAINELQISDGVTQFLPPQRADHWDASVEYALDGGIDLRLEAYWKEYEERRPRYENLLNSFVLLPELKPDRIEIAPDEALAEGVEASLRYEAKALSAWIAYTRSRVDDRVDGEWLHRSWDQRDYATGGLTWRWESWEASLAAAWHRGWPTTAVELATLEPFPLVEVDKRNAANVSNYSRFDARIARRFDLGEAGELTAFVEVSNLTKRNNDCCVEYQLEDEEGEDVFLDVEPRGSLPLIPSVGVLWKF